MRTANRCLALASLIAGVTLTAGCATPATSVAMTATSATAVHQIGSDVSVAVSGGKETSSTGASQISDQAFAQALRDSIEKSGLFAKVSPSGARYKLTGFIGKVDQPLLGFSLTVKMEVSYTLVDTQSGTTLWTKDIASQYTAKTGEAFAAVKRLRLANEGAARENIQQAIAAMATLTL
ncbi:MAG: hypothetical protein E6K39_04005 [Gammaproteobacteria bacterium]|nr:MAG: hypothetical protein E6K39_04005 [Gammaproteobacteria bacterium]